MTLKGRVLLLALGVLLASLAGVGVVLRGYVEGPRVEAERERMLRAWDAGARILRHDPTLPAAPNLAAPALGEILGMRVTLVAPDGTVLGDSGVPGGDVRAMESHAGRPEIQAALAGRVEVMERRSPTQGIPTFYVAGPLDLLEGEPLVLRVAAPVGTIRGPLDRAPLFLLLLALAGILVLVPGVGLVLRPLGRGVAALEAGLVGLAQGDPARTPGRDAVVPELVPLATASHRLGEEVTGRTREITRERDELLALVDAMDEGVLALTEDARVLHLNRALTRILEVPAPEPFAPIATLVRHPGLRDHLEEAVVLPLPRREFQVGARTLLVSAHRLEGGGAVVTFLDVTELRRVEQIRRDFVANASHELKTPLTSMRGFAEMLLEGDPPAELRHQFLDSIRSNTLRLQALVDDLLDLSRLEAGAWKLQEEEVEVAEIAGQVWRELDQPPGERGVDFQVEGSGVALADAQALAHVFRNLLDNALRYTPREGRIGVRVESMGPLLQVSVTDTGVGIPSSALPRIFERFYRVDPGRDRAAGGTGLGLSIVRHLVQAMGGEVRAESELGVGTRIHFTLPRVE